MSHFGTKRDKNVPLKILKQNTLQPKRQIYWQYGVIYVKNGHTGIKMSHEKK